MRSIILKLGVLTIIGKTVVEIFDRFENRDLYARLINAETELERIKRENGIPY